MYSLKIVDPTYWRDSWSARIGQSLKILNSTYNLFIFNEETGKEDISRVLEGIPTEAYQLFKVRPSTSGICEIDTDNGQCFEET
jgi:hypothetical protein